VAAAAWRVGLLLVGAAGGAQDLETANLGQQLEAVVEAEVRKGSEACVRRNDVAAVELLLAVLRREAQPSRRHLPPAHYRDIAFEGLEQIKDPYARRRVESELKSNKESAAVRQWCAELLGHYGDASFGATLDRALDDQDVGVQRAAARSLGQLAFKDAAPKLQRRLYHKDPIVRGNAFEALARIDRGAHRAAYLQAMQKDADGGVRCALLGALPELYPDDVEAAAAAARKDPDWRPRIQAVENLGAVQTKTAVDALLLALDDPRPVVADRSSAMLRRLTGQKIRDAATWKAWWKDHREGFAFPEPSVEAADSRPRTVAYMGIDVVSDHVAFLLDRSYQMGAQLASKGMRKDEAAREELAAVLAHLHGRLVFNVFLYAEDVTAFAREPQKLSPAAQKKALAFLEQKTSGRQKDIWHALETVLADPDIDTAYLLSSGEPDTGLYVHWNRVTSHLRDLNRFRKLVVHTIAYSDVQWYRDQLQKIAETTGGEFRWFR
jgi:HEAT repeat protein